jgi:hypothetical protein
MGAGKLFVAPISCADIYDVRCECSRQPATTSGQHELRPARGEQLFAAIPCPSPLESDAPRAMADATAWIAVSIPLDRMDRISSARATRSTWRRLGGSPGSTHPPQFRSPGRISTTGGVAPPYPRIASAIISASAGPTPAATSADTASSASTLRRSSAVSTAERPSRSSLTISSRSASVWTT